MAQLRSPSNGELLFSPDDISRLFRLVSEIADRRDIEPSEVIERLELRLAAATARSEQVVNGIRLGLLLALASVGLSLIYGTTGLSNFAHAEQVTLGGMLAGSASEPTRVAMNDTVPVAPDGLPLTVRQ